MAPRVTIICAPGFEEVEAVTPIDLLRRAGVEVTVAGLGSTTITGSHGIALHADRTVDGLVDPGEGLVLPGGMPGTTNLLASPATLSMTRECFDRGLLCAAICAAPRVLDAAGILEGHRYTCYPGTEQQISSGLYTAEPVVRDCTIVTSKGVGTAVAFALELVDYLVGADASRKLGENIVYSP